MPFLCCVSQLHYLQTEHCFGNSFSNCKWLVLHSKVQIFFAVFPLSSLTPHDCSDGAGGDSCEQVGSLPAGWGCSWVLLGLLGWHRQAAVGKTAVWLSRASSCPWTDLQLGCNPDECPACPGLWCLFLGGKWSVGVLLLGYITSCPELTHGFCLFCLQRVGSASCQQLIFYLKESGYIVSPGRRGRDIRQVLACISWQHGLQSGQFMWDWQTEAVSAWPHSHRSLLLSSFEKLPFICLLASTFNQIGNCSL